ncbi:ferrous iron transport protein B [Cytophagales bacterium LB-30]|uniref:Ferrous iron transport protein B n=1 Tax=Shiella aurantiaca TaxID=3058365 RepID=A0ABT8F616_9BACT|nr:ferrous iron transport protein B [Shiella aurantiaca]MDN4165830.1 ferrous iron transport protein B [Shiella aurantiaca]
MPLKSHPKIALLGNPNSGKSSLFNHLTGLNQKIGNFPGVTVDMKSGHCKLDDNVTAELIDLPGVYSLYPRSLDEKIVFDLLSNVNHASYPDLVVVVVDASNIRRNLLLFSQIYDLGIPVVMALNMLDVAIDAGLTVDIEALKKELGIQVVQINARKGTGIEDLKKALAAPKLNAHEPMFVPSEGMELVDLVKSTYGIENTYLAYQVAQQSEDITWLDAQQKSQMAEWKREFKFYGERLQRLETVARYQKINELVSLALKEASPKKKNQLTRQLDAIFTHRIGGYLIFFFILFVIFQAIFAWASVPMDFIDSTVAQFSQWLANRLPEGVLTSLFTEGVIPGIGGVLIFVPQIALLFGFIAVLEESGYMARVVFLMDKIMRRFGLNGKSVVPLISGVACAIPAVMATRNIDNWKERIITIMVTPLMSCSARLPIYTILIAITVPDINYFGVINLHGIALMGMYLLGFFAALLSAWLMKLFMRTKERSYFIMELPLYKSPRWINVGVTIVDKVKAFVFEAGKIILAISIVLWVLASYGPGDAMDHAEENALPANWQETLSEKEAENKIAAYKLENSYAGTMGKWIEPVIKPLGFDWKIGIALITSFAAREVFVGTMATIYSVGVDADDESTIKSRMRAEINPDTGKPMYSTALSISLLIFYAFAMQCMSTVAVVYRETKGWKWPLIQTAYMTGLAYLSSLLVYQLLK